MVGNIVQFGHYEQDNNMENAKEPIEWTVLDYDAKNDRALLLSRYGLDAKPYNTKCVDITWEKCTLRKWLNGEFLNNAFSKAERRNILKTKVDNSKNQAYGGREKNGGKNTQDKIFLLSCAEADQYLGVTTGSANMKARISPTAYALQAGAWTNYNGYKTEDGAVAGWWWLRSPGNDPYLAAYISIDGTLSSYRVDIVIGCVRPALWVNLKSDFN